ncbi:hypothetical protein JST97_30100 [bacterium]|nr:hypothetical protein [bacterium]
MKDPLETVSGALVGRASVESVFGQPIQVGDKTFVPVARIQYGLGGGFNHGSPGAGGGLEAIPLGVLELSRQGARFLALAETHQSVEESAPGIVTLAPGAWLLEHQGQFALIHPTQPGAWLQRIAGPVQVVVGETPLFPQARRPKAPWRGHLAGEPLFILEVGVVFRGVALGSAGLDDFRRQLPENYHLHTALA